MEMDKDLADKIKSIREECPDLIIRDEGIYIECFIRNGALHLLLEALIMTSCLAKSD